MEEIIDIIHRNHDVAVIAHSGVNLKGREYLLEDILKPVSYTHLTLPTKA